MRQENRNCRGRVLAVTKSISRVPQSHAVPARSARFDDLSLASFARLVPAVGSG